MLSSLFKSCAAVSRALTSSLKTIHPSIRNEWTTQWDEQTRNPHTREKTSWTPEQDIHPRAYPRMFQARMRQAEKTTPLEASAITHAPVKTASDYQLGWKHGILQQSWTERCRTRCSRSFGQDTLNQQRRYSRHPKLTIKSQQRYRDLPQSEMRHLGSTSDYMQSPRSRSLHWRLPSTGKRRYLAKGEESSWTTSTRQFSSTTTQLTWWKKTGDKPSSGPSLGQNILSEDAKKNHRTIERISLENPSSRTGRTIKKQLVLQRTRNTNAHLPVSWQQVGKDCQAEDVQQHPRRFATASDAEQRTPAANAAPRQSNNRTPNYQGRSDGRRR